RGARLLAKYDVVRTADAVMMELYACADGVACHGAREWEQVNPGALWQSNGFLNSASGRTSHKGGYAVYQALRLVNAGRLGITYFEQQIRSMCRRCRLYAQWISSKENTPG